jgi:hypothetical protein
MARELSTEYPSHLEDSQLMLNDFDDTEAFTSERAPGIPTVNDGYASGIDELFGAVAVERFLRKGHGHRTPTEIVANIMNLPPDKEEVREAAAFVTRRKLEVVSSAIGKPLEDGTPYPRQSEGFSETWMGVYAAQEEGFPLGKAVVSSGHTEYEQRVFDMWGLPQPDMYLTDDVVNAMALQIPWVDQVKPSPMLVEVAQTIHAYKLKRTHEAFKNSNLLASSIRTIYVGNAPQDEQLARNARIAYTNVGPNRQREAWYEAAEFLGIEFYVVRYAQKQ